MLKLLNKKIIEIIFINKIKSTNSNKNNNKKIAFNLRLKLIYFQNKLQGKIILNY